MAKAKLILVPSEKMDNNKKEDRNEHGLVRMPSAARKNMGFDKTVELSPDTKSADRLIKSVMQLEIFQAFAADIKKLKADGFTAEELKRVGFVTTRTFRKVTGAKDKKPRKNIWISNDVSKTIIGADPEFLLFNKDGGVVRANNVLGYHGQLGCDGAMAEVRPKPAITPEDLTANIKAIFGNKGLTSDISNYDWMAGCYYKDHQRDYPMGGHIHIGNPIQLANLDSSKRDQVFKVMNKIIDEMLAIPLIKIDGAELGRARRTECVMGKYGYFGEWRRCNGRLEHRTLSGMWLMHPKLTECVFGTAKCIIDEIFARLAAKKFSVAYALPTKYHRAAIWRPDFSEWDKSPLAKDMGCIRDSREMVELLHTSSANNITAAFMRQWLAHIKKFSTYPKYAKYVDGLFEILKQKTKAFHDYEKELKKNWLTNRKFIGE
jgi:hypothetical protein